MTDLKQEGFSLIELMVTLVVVAVALSLAAPSFREFVLNNRMTTEINNLAAALNLARSEAIKRSMPVSVCKISRISGSQDGTSKDCSTSPLVNWEDGWMVFVNTDNDSPAKVDSGEIRLKTFNALRSGMTLRASSSLSNYITYLPSGISNASGMFVLCHENKVSRSKAIIVSPTGQVIVAPDNNNNDIPDQNDGTDITSCTP